MFAPIEFDDDLKEKFYLNSKVKLREDRPLEVIFRYNGGLAAGNFYYKKKEYFSLGGNSKFYYSKVQSPFYDFLTGKEIQV